MKKSNGSCLLYFFVFGFICYLIQTIIEFVQNNALLIGIILAVILVLVCFGIFSENNKSKGIPPYNNKSVDSKDNIDHLKYGNNKYNGNHGSLFSDNTKQKDLETYAIQCEYITRSKDFEDALEHRDYSFTGFEYPYDEKNSE